MKAQLDYHLTVATVNIGCFSLIGFLMVNLVYQMKYLLKNQPQHKTAGTHTFKMLLITSQQLSSDGEN